MTRLGLTVACYSACLCLIPLSGVAYAQRGPAPAATGLAADVIALACAPKAAFEVPPQPLHITGGQDVVERRSFQPGDLVTINAGTDNGIDVGQEYFARRIQTWGTRTPSRTEPGTIQTTGWIRVYAVDKEMSLATISHACDTVDVGDYLEPFVIPTVPAAELTFAKPQRENYARIMFGTDGRHSFALRDFFVIDHGSDHGVRVGSRFVVFHDKVIKGNFLYDIGEAVAVEVTPETSTLQVTVARTSMTAGDYVAIRK